MSDLVQMKDLKERVAETVRSSFGELIPKDKWVELVEKEIDAYFESQVTWEWDATSRGSYNSYQALLKTKTTPFRQQVWSAVHEIIRERLNEYLDSEGFKKKVKYEAGDVLEASNELPDKMEERLEEWAGKMAAVAFRGIFEEAVSQARQDIANSIMDHENERHGG